MKRPPNPCPASLLEPHPSLALVPTRDELLARHEALTVHNAEWRHTRDDLHQSVEQMWGSIRQHGVKVPVKVVFVGGKALVVDGRNRLAAARAADLSVPWEEVPATKIDETVETSLFDRNHFTPFQRAYIAVRRHPEVLEGKPGRRKSNSGDPLFVSQEAIARLADVHLDTVKRAIALVKKFAHAELDAEQWEWRIFTGFELQQTSCAGAATKTEDNGTRTVERHVKNFKERCGTLFTLVRDTWGQEQTGAAQRQELVCSAAQFLLQAPEEFRTSVLRTLKNGLPPGWEGFKRQEKSRVLQTHEQVLAKTRAAAEFYRNLSNAELKEDGHADD